MAWRESRPNLAKHSSYHNVSKILVVQESNVSSELNSDLVVRLCFSVTITTQEEGHYQPFIICKACVYKKSVKNERFGRITVLPDVVRSGIPPKTTSAGFSSSSESRSLSSSPPSVTSATTIPTKKGPLFGYPRMWSRLTTTTLLASNKMAPLTASCSISVTTVSLAVRSSVVEKSNGLGG